MPSAEPPSTIPELVARVARERGSHPAIVTASETVTYTELEQRSARLARALLATGMGKGTRIALLAPDGVFWTTAFLAALRIGALVTPISTLCAPPELAHQLRNSDCQHLIAIRRMLTHDYASTLSAAFPDLGSQTSDCLRLTAAPYLRRIWLDDVEHVPWASPLAALEAMADQPCAPGGALLAAAEREVSPADDAVVAYTSGSTSHPKAVLHRQWALARHPIELARQFALRPDDRMMCLLPSFWVAGMSMALQVLGTGATLVYPEKPTIEDAVNAIAHLAVTRVNAWGGKQALLVDAARRDGIPIHHIPDLAGFRDAGGNVLPDTIAMYGMTESFSAHSAHPLGEALPQGKENAFGRSINGYERRVVDLVTGSELPAGSLGELQIRGPAMLAGFYKHRAQDVFTADGFYPTRDMVHIDAAGWLVPHGRLDDMIKTRGANVSRLEVEQALASISGVGQAVVAGLPDPAMGKMIAAAVVPDEGAALDEVTLMAALRQRLSSFKVPKRIVFVAADDIPRTATGKVCLPEVIALISRHLHTEHALPPTVS